MQTIAMYLPQFHRVKENDEWWGEGFTDWTAVRQAIPLFEGHKQPREPMDDNYYDLSDIEVMRNQAELARRFRVDGFCFYHYYFADGRKILEKPVEAFCRQKDIDMQYCLCWANETWARSWNKIGQNNTWADKFEIAGNHEKSVLLQQNYGRELAWEEHFYYLLPFFKDSRYIRNEKKEPIFLLYRPHDIYCLADMVVLWQKLAKKEGLNRICIIGLNMHESIDGVDAILINGPSRFISKSTSMKMDGVNTYDYEEVWRHALEEPTIESVKTYFGGFQNYDDTPRRGRRGCVITGATPQKFKYFFRELVNKNYCAGNEFVFLNAWNEWGEGMYLEPDKLDKCEYLQAIFEVMGEERVQQVNELPSYSADSKLVFEDKYYRYYQLMNKWMHIRDENRTVTEYFEKYKFNKIAIYGMGGMGEHLLKELERSNIDIAYCIDQDEATRKWGIPQKTLADNLEKVDVIVVTPTYYYDEIRRQLKQQLDCTIVSLEEVVDDVLYNKELG